MAKGDRWREMRLGVPTCRLFSQFPKDPASGQKDTRCGVWRARWRDEGKRPEFSGKSMRDESLK